MTPLPNLPGNLLSSNYYATAPFIFDRQRLDAKVNWNASSRFTTFVRFGFLNYNMENPPIFGEAVGTQVASQGGNTGHGYGHTYSVTAAATYTLSPSFVMTNPLPYAYFC